MSVFDSKRCQSFEIVPVTKNTKTALYDLIQEQASVHGSAAPAQVRRKDSQRLFAAVDRGECEAFLVYDHKLNRAVTAVTYYDCVTPYGRGVYLEDIVTAHDQRGHGSGTWGFTGLSQIALDRGANALRWECATNNIRAWIFYFNLGSERLVGRQTWRHEGELKGPGWQGDLIVRPLGAQDSAEGLLEEGAGVELDHPRLETFGFLSPSGQVEGLAQAYQSFSTFRIVSGLHVETLAVRGQDPDIAATLIERLWERRRSQWPGHLDITVSRAQESWLIPVLRQMGFAPLEYGGDTMVARVLRGDALQEVAARPGRNLIGKLQRPANQGNGGVASGERQSSRRGEYTL